MTLPSGGAPPFDDALVDEILAQEEGLTFETKRVGDNTRKIQTVVAFSNAEGGWMALGLEDAAKASGRGRVYGIQENPESLDELRRLLRQRITPPLSPPDAIEPTFTEVGCTLRDGTRGSILIVRVTRSANVHSIVDGGTFIRVGRTTRQISAAEITELALRRGTTSVVNAPVVVPFDLLETSYWREYAAHRRLTRPIAEAMRHLGLAREDASATLRPTRAAVLLFAEDPGGLLDSKSAVRLLHYRGESVEHVADTNMVRPPKTIGGPLIFQIRDAAAATLEALATGVQVGALGFEIAQSYPVRVIKEAITNAVLHRDYRLAADIQIRIFSDRIEVESPGLLPAPVTVTNLREIGSRPRNRALVDHLREFPIPPNLDAGEGVRMMFATMDRASLYPPVYLTVPDIARESVVVILSNEARASAWDQVSAHLDGHGSIGNADVRKILGAEDPLRASKLLRAWVGRGLLVVANPEAAKQHRRYRRPGTPPQEALFSIGPGKQPPESGEPRQ